MCPDVRHPIRDALFVLVGAEPPQFVQGYDYADYNDAQHHQLQDWVGTVLDGRLSWSTAIGIIDAAERIVAEAVSNANIPPKEHWDDVNQAELARLEKMDAALRKRAAANAKAAAKKKAAQRKKTKKVAKTKTRKVKA
jgi:hypothetical protein